MKAILAERGDDEEPEPELIAQCINDARVAEGLLPLPVAGNGARNNNNNNAAAHRESKSQKEDDEDEGGDDSHGGGGAAAAAAASMPTRGGGEISLTDSASGADLIAATGLPPPPPPPRKVLTCVLFADTNTHVLLTGDDRGRVDVYRVVGLGGGAAEADVYGQHELLRSVIQTL